MSDADDNQIITLTRKALKALINEAVIHALKIAREEWELEHAELKNNYQQVYQLAIERNQVIQNKRELLTEMLTKCFHMNIQDIKMRTAQHEPLRQETTPYEIVSAVKHWVNYYWKYDTNRCDLNARACWATICGSVNRDWVICRTGTIHIFNAQFIQNKISMWPDVYAQWKDDGSNRSMIVRFMGNTDGHTIVLYKHETKIYVFQAYYMVCPLHMSENDIFDRELNTKLKHGEYISANDFGNVKAYDNNEVPCESYVYPSEQYTTFTYMVRSMT